MRPPRERSARREVDPQRGQHRLDIDCSLLRVLALQVPFCVLGLYCLSLPCRLSDRLLIHNLVCLLLAFGDLPRPSILVFQNTLSFALC